MPFKNTVKLGLFSVLLLFLITSLFIERVDAQESLPVIFINSNTGECVHLYEGTECLDCYFTNPLDEDWIRNDDLSVCPSSYKQVKRSHECTVNETPECCTINEAGLGGNCKDVVIKGAERKCAFVKDLSACETLPEGWEKAGEEDGWGVVCPSEDYEWEEVEIDCEGNRVSQYDGIIADYEASILLLEKDDENQKVILLAGASLLIGFLLWWFYFRKRRIIN